MRITDIYNELYHKDEIEMEKIAEQGLELIDLGRGIAQEMMKEAGLLDTSIKAVRNWRYQKALKNWAKKSSTMVQSQKVGKYKGKKLTEAVSQKLGKKSGAALSRAARRASKLKGVNPFSDVHKYNPQWS